MRSASARATAQGVTVDEVLQAWGGGTTAPTGGAPTATAAASVAAAPVRAAAPAATAAPVATAVVPSPIMVELPDTEEPVDPPGVGLRLRHGGRIGAFMGALGGLLVAVFGISSTFDSFGVTDGVVTASAGKGTVLVAIAGIMALVGIVIARAAVSTPVALDRNFRVEAHPVVTSLVGLGTGGVLGAAIGAVLLGRGSVDVVDEAIVHLPVSSSFLFALVGAAIAGALIGMAAQASAVPAGLTGPERDAALAVRRRLATGYIFPALIVVAIGVAVVSLGTILLTFHTAAPVIAVVVAGSILTFGFLSGGRPKIRAGRTEVLVALVTLALLVYFLVIITNAMAN